MKLKTTKEYRDSFRGGWSRESIYKSVAWDMADDIETLLAERDALKAAMELILGYYNNPDLDYSQCSEFVRIARDALAALAKEKQP